ncbi:MAG: cation:proton antiporter [Candidatus Thorarchaeota archaeon]
MANEEFGIYLAVVILIGGAVLAKIAERYKLPYPIPLMLAGVALKYIIIDTTIFEGFPLALIAQLTLASVLFYAGLTMNIRELRSSLRSVAALATVGVVLTSLIAGGTIWLALPTLGLGVAFIIGAILSPTDPAALFSVLESGGVRVKRKLFSTLEGEAVFNDATAVIVVITVFLPFVIPALAQPWWVVVGQFISSMVLGGFLGFGIAWLMSKTLLNLEGSTNTAIVTAATPIIAYGVGELFAVFGIHPGALAAVFAGLFMANSRMIGLKILPQKSMRGVMKNVSFVFEIIVFIFLGYYLDIATMTIEIIAVGGIVALLVIFIARPVSVFVVTAFDKTMNWKDRFFISWAGVKGVASAALAAIVVAEVMEVDPAIAGPINSIVFIVVIASLVLQGISSPRLATILGLVEEQDAAQEIASMRDATRHALLKLVDKYTEGKVSGDIYSRLKAELEEEIYNLEDELRRLVSDKRARMRELEIREDVYREKLAFFEAEYEKGKVPSGLFEDQRRELQAEIDELTIQRKPQADEEETS